MLLLMPAQTGKSFEKYFYNCGNKAIIPAVLKTQGKCRRK